MVCNTLCTLWNDPIETFRFGGNANAQTDNLDLSFLDSDTEWGGDERKRKKSTAYRVTGKV